MRYLVLLMMVVGCGGTPGAEPGQEEPETFTPGEVEPWALEGSYVIHNSMDAMALEGCVLVTGDLEVDAPGLRSLRGLEALQQVDGTLSIHDSPALADLSALAGLQHVAGSLRVTGELDADTPVLDADRLQRLPFPSLTEVGGTMRIVNNAALEALDMPALRRVGSNFEVQFNPALPSCAAQALVDTLEDVRGTILVRANDDTATCQ